MTNLLDFTFEGRVVRTIERNGVTEWFAKDVCEILTIANPSDALSSLDADEKGRFTELVSSEIGDIPRTYTTVTESGLYALMFKSRKREAVRFRKWITSVVLPQIRQHGYFLQQQEIALLHGNLEIVKSRLLKMTARVIALDNPQLLKSEAAGIRQRIKILSVIRNRDNSISDLVSFRRVDNELRGRVEYPVASGHRWESLPRRRLGDVLLALDEMEKEDADLFRSRERHRMRQEIQEELKLNLN